MTSEERSAICDEATSWIGTRYANNTALKGVGCDCAGFLLGVFKNAGIADADAALPKYSPQFALHNTEEAYSTYLLRYLREIPEADIQPGDVVLYLSGLSYSHSAIVIAWPDRVVHAIRSGGVQEAHGTKESWLQGRRRRVFTAHR